MVARRGCGHDDSHHQGQRSSAKGSPARHSSLSRTGVCAVYICLSVSMWRTYRQMLHAEVETRRRACMHVCMHACIHTCQPTNIHACNVTHTNAYLSIPGGSPQRARQGAVKPGVGRCRKVLQVTWNRAVAYTSCSLASVARQSSESDTLVSLQVHHRVFCSSVVH